MSSGISPSNVITVVGAGVKGLQEALGLVDRPIEYNPTFMPRNSALCEQCQSIFSETRVFTFERSTSENITNRLIIHPQWVGDCRLCEMLLYGLSDGSNSSSEVTEPLEIQFWLVNDPMFLYGSYYMRFETLNSEGVSTKKFKLLIASLELDEDSHWQKRMEMPQWEPLSKRTSSAKSLKYFDSWLRTCKKNHELCHKAQSHGGKFVPKRLLHSYRSGKDRRLRLIRTQGLKSNVQYMTLSHCWGNIKITTLQRSSFNSFLEDIPLDSLPQLFVDAISIASRAGINYIWIDSLCIIQDSPDDWARESAKMGRIYQHGYCNIAGTGFSDGSQGLFASRKPSSLEPIEHYIDCDIKLANSPVIKQGPHLLLDYNLWKSGVDKGPLTGRGWVLQERVLSPRTIHFGSGQLYWECLQHSTCEIFPTKWPHRMRRYTLKSAPNTSRPPSEQIAAEIAEVEEELESLNRELQEVEEEEVWTDDSASDPGFSKDLHERQLKHLRERKESRVKRLFHLRNPDKTFNRGWCNGNRHWNRLMKMYSSCNLTVATDKLMAISGLAQDQQKSMDGDYLAGLWRTALEHQLIWKVVKPQTAPEPQSLRGPSWSWAYVDGKTEFAIAPDQDGGIIYPSIIDARVVLAKKDDRFGPVVSGMLRVSGVLGVFNLQAVSEEGSTPTDPLVFGDELDVALHWDTQDLHDKYSISFLKVPHTYDSFKENAWQQGSEMEKRIVFFMPIRSMGADPDFDMAITLLGLLLVPTTQVRGQYRRVGLFESRVSRARGTENGRIDWGVLEKNIKELDSQFYEAVDEDGKFMISIV